MNTTLTSNIANSALIAVTCPIQTKAHRDRIRSARNHSSILLKALGLNGSRDSLLSFKCHYYKSAGPRRVLFGIRIGGTFSVSLFAFGGSYFLVCSKACVFVEVFRTCRVLRLSFILVSDWKTWRFCSLIYFSEYFVIFIIHYILNMYTTTISMDTMKCIEW